MSPRLRRSLTQGLLTTGVFFVVRLLMLQIPGRSPEPLAETITVSLVVGVLVAAWTWWRWPSHQRRAGGAGGQERLER